MAELYLYFGSQIWMSSSPLFHGITVLLSGRKIVLTLYLLTLTDAFIQSDSQLTENYEIKSAQLSQT